MNEVFFCPVCGRVTNEELLKYWDGKKCLSCGSDLQGTGKDFNSFWLRSDDKQERRRLLKRLEETVREEYVYNNPLFDKEKYEAREQADRERIERNKAGLNPLDNLPKCPTCGSTNLSRLSGVGMRRLRRDGRQRGQNL
ncbi:MAG: hypothetical protein E6123_14475 [Clostridiales bacterium]|nr:hypothetical protein [Clostridiales bacterium]